VSSVQRLVIVAGVATRLSAGRQINRVSSRDTAKRFSVLQNCQDRF
jgi:hypothetical protein